MGEKLLTVSIAAYNVEKYLEECVSSAIIDDYMKYLEIIIVDDGSTDGTGRIGKAFADKWPDSIIYHRKENGGYGTTLNCSVPMATGKYFRILDGDDRFETEGLRDFLDYVLQGNDCDAIVSQAVRWQEGKAEKPLFVMPEEYRKVFSLENLKCAGDIAAWGYAFRTDLVKKEWVDLPGHAFYTDRIYLIHCLKNTQTISFLGSTLYKYRIGDVNQSTSRQSIRKHYKEAVEADRILAEMVNEGDLWNDYLVRRAGTYYGTTVCMLLELPKTLANFRQIKSLEREMKESFPVAYYKAGEAVKRVWILRKTFYLAFFIWPVIDNLKKRILQ